MALRPIILDTTGKLINEQLKLIAESVRDYTPLNNKPKINGKVLEANEDRLLQEPLNGESGAVGQNIKTINNVNIVGPGNITVDKDFVGLDQVDNTSDVNKPISIATQDALNTKVTSVIISSNGNARVFNEADGGGAKFEHIDGTLSFVGVNDPSDTGLAGQLYVVKKEGDNYDGSRLDLTRSGFYYTKGHDSIFDRTIAENEIATIRDINTRTPIKLNSSEGSALMFNEADGGGAKYEHVDGTNSFVGVNDGGQFGIAAQIYAIDKNDPTDGSKLNVKKDGIYYVKNKASSAQTADDEITTKGDLKTEITLKGVKLYGDSMVKTSSKEVYIEEILDSEKFITALAAKLLADPNNALAKKIAELQDAVEWN